MARVAIEEDEMINTPEFRRAQAAQETLEAAKADLAAAEENTRAKRAALAQAHKDWKEAAGAVPVKVD